MKIKKNTVVTLSYKLYDAQNNDLLDGDEQTIIYLHGGYFDIFEKIEQQLENKKVGYSFKIQLEPDDAFGQYDSELLKLEDKNKFPEDIAVGMQFEGLPYESNEEYQHEVKTAEDIEDPSEDTYIFTVTDIVGDKVLLDGNHPLAGMAVRFDINIIDIRNATEEEIDNQSAIDEEQEGIFSIGEHKKKPTLH